jgi:hypothetical protein
MIQINDICKVILKKVLTGISGKKTRKEVSNQEFHHSITFIHSIAHPYKSFCCEAETLRA